MKDFIYFKSKLEAYMSRAHRDPECYEKAYEIIESKKAHSKAVDTVLNNISETWNKRKSYVMPLPNIPSGSDQITKRLIQDCLNLLQMLHGVVLSFPLEMSWALSNKITASHMLQLTLADHIPIDLRLVIITLCSRWCVLLGATPVARYRLASMVDRFYLSTRLLPSSTYLPTAPAIVVKRMNGRLVRVPTTEMEIDMSRDIRTYLYMPEIAYTNESDIRIGHATPQTSQTEYHHSNGGSSAPSLPKRHDQQQLNDSRNIPVNNGSVPLAIQTMNEAQYVEEPKTLPPPLPRRKTEPSSPLATSNDNPILSLPPKPPKHILNPFLRRRRLQKENQQQHRQKVQQLEEEEEKATNNATRHQGSISTTVSHKEHPHETMDTDEEGTLQPLLPPTPRPRPPASCSQPQTAAYPEITPSFLARIDTCSQELHSISQMLIENLLALPPSENPERNLVVQDFLKELEQRQSAITNYQNMLPDTYQTEKRMLEGAQQESTRCKGVYEDVKMIHADWIAQQMGYEMDVVGESSKSHNYMSRSSDNVSNNAYLLESVLVEQPLQANLARVSTKVRGKMVDMEASKVQETA